VTGRPATWTAQRKPALAIAAEWSLPGLAPDDVRQEALLALWVAAGKHDPARGPWPPFARMCVKAHLRDLLQAATRVKRTAVLERDVDVAAPARDDGGLAEVLASMSVLSGRERDALAAHLNGTPVDDNALWRARRKLRAAA
jgi:DNA-directed RNA polymerase specialized sigma24 family protein